MKRNSSDKPSILFVYNADSGIANALLDYGKKYVAPSKYDCQLCMLSYGPFGMKNDWKKFTNNLPYPVEFLHKDELEARYPNVKTSLPAMVLYKDGGAEVLLDGANFESIKSLVL